MPALTAPAKVLVSGASGFLAAHIIKDLLAAGFSVIGTVRSPPKGDYLVKTFGDKFSYVIVKDIGSNDAFDEAVKGVDAVFHTASPFHMAADDPQEIIGPAVNGTVNILNSILKNGSDVKRVVITSSGVSLMEPKSAPPPVTYDETDWNKSSVALVEKEGKAAPGYQKYFASKTLAERAAWEFYEKNKSSISWDLVTILPPYIFGAPLHEVKGVSGLNESLAMFYSWFTNAPLPKEALAPYTGAMVDASDVARAHTLALTTPAAGGERFIVASITYTTQQIYDLLNAEGAANVPKGFPGCDAESTRPYDMLSGKAEKILGLKITPPGKTLVKMLEGIRTRFPDEAKA